MATAGDCVGALGLPGSRRDFLGLSAGLLAATSLPGMARAAIAPGRSDGARKFAPDGRVLPYAGSTVICHLPQQGEPVPGAYQFHITLAYLIQPFAAAERDEALAVMLDYQRRVAEAAPIVILGAPEYCTFEDMFAFVRQFFIGKS